MFTGLRSIIYPSTNLEIDKKFWQDITGQKPYFDESYYVGFEINGCELGLDPGAAKQGLTCPVTYWRVKSIKEATEHVLSSGAKVNSDVQDVGGGILMSRFTDS